MAKFLLACYPIAGHLNPNIALAQELRSRGHGVAIYSGSMAQSAAEAEGYQFFQYHPDMDRQIMSILMPTDGQTFTAADITSKSLPFLRVKQIKEYLSRWFLSTVPRQIEDLTSVIASWKPNVLVTDISLFGPILVLHDTQPIPVAAFCVLPACSLPGSDAPTWGRGLPPPRNWFSRLRSKVEQRVMNLLLSDFRAEVNVLRSRYGLPPITVSVTQFSGQLPLYLVTGAPEFDYNRSDLPDTVHYVGPCLWHRPQQESPPKWLSQLPRDRPVVYVTEGTVHVKRPVVLKAAAEGLADRPVHVVMTSGKHRDAASLGLNPVAPNIRIVEYVSHGDLFQHVDVVVTTGGAGTVLTALIFGVPLVVVPTGWDLPENAQRIEEAGVGVRLNPQRCSGERLRSAIFSVLGDPNYRRNARHIGAALSRQGGPVRAAELLERLASVHAGSMSMANNTEESAKKGIFSQ